MIAPGRTARSHSLARRSMQYLAGASSLLIVACFPAVMHGPRIENGIGVGGTASLSSGTRYTEGDEGNRLLRVGHVGAHVSVGKAASTPRRPGFQASVAVPLTLLAQLDLFVQAPPAWTGPLSAGYGVNATEERVDHYVQVGHIRDDGNGWFLTQGLSRRVLPSDRVSPIVSVSGATAQFARGAFRHFFFLQYGTGLIPSQCGDRTVPGCADGPRGHSVAAGVTIERRWRTQKR